MDLKSLRMSSLSMEIGNYVDWNRLIVRRKEENECVKSCLINLANNEHETESCYLHFSISSGEDK